MCSVSEKMRNLWKISFCLLFIQKFVCTDHVNTSSSSYGETTTPLSINSEPGFREPMENVTAKIGGEAIPTSSEQIVNASTSSYGETTTPLSINTEPGFREPMENVTAKIGGEAILTCSVTDLGDNRVVWGRVKDHAVLSVHTIVVMDDPRLSVTHDDNQRTWRLHIRPFEENDRGCYTCQINTSIIKKQLGCIEVVDV